MYIAVNYIGGKYVPGEVIPDDMSRDELDWLIRAGAVRKAAPDPDARRPQEAEIQHGAEAPEPTDAPEDTEESEDEIDEDEEAPEIDAMAGIVQGGAEESAKPAVKRKAAAHASGKKTPKGGKAK